MIKVLILLALGMVILSITYYLFSNHITLDIKSLFLKGFKKQDNDYGLYAYTGKQGKRQDLYLCKIPY